MDLLKSIINKQKQAVSAEAEASGGKRWIQRGKAAQQLREEVQRKALEDEKKRKREEIERLQELARHLEAKKRKDTNAANHSEDVAVVHELMLNAEEAQPPLSKQEIFKKLRKLKEPVTLFGETDWQRYTRLCHLELLHHEDELMGGQRNAFLNPQDDDEEEEDEENHKETASVRRRAQEGDRASSTATSGSLHAESDPGGRAPTPADSGKDGVAAKVSETCGAGSPGAPPDTAAEARAKDGGSPEAEDEDENEVEDASSNPAEKKDRQCSKETTVTRWIRRMLQEWEAELKLRPDEKKSSAEGTLMTSLQRQTRKDLKPLIRKLKQKELDKDVLDKLFTMVQCCEERKYRSAHDTYMLLAIGNAAWPVGVTMVGIHERVGRSKLFSSQVAHILNDETTRKYIQMFKRLMSFCQRRYPADPSQTISLSTIHI
ncbi:Prp18 domain-containing protein [Besnoitia besnoiti]|uniref:Pre-mRNA-splicing factor 18 n=1 Tax=Besnoitia besnoiti TaxID=94643 RepID=A0A2A9MFA5_BESBE|nr:Prp18 domain-containing protein [Besnoitia besnoiti]PFH34941.1 Prp18 domain-containing protein [Besnoitia besnoiti]